MARLLNDAATELLEKRLLNLEKDLKRQCMREMINAGADVLAKAWQTTIQDRRHVRTGAMLAAVSKTDVTEEEDGVSIEVYPEGTDNHRINNAQKAYILHYGRNPNKRGKKAIKGDKFVTAAEKRDKELILSAMQAVLDKYISGKG